MTPLCPSSDKDPGGLLLLPEKGELADMDISKFSVSVLWHVRGLSQNRVRVPVGSVPLSIHKSLCKHRPVNLRVLRKDARE